MKDILLLTVCLGLLSCTAAPRATRSVAGLPSAAEAIPEKPERGYAILKEGTRQDRNWLGLNEYYPAHHLYTDILYRLRLHRRFSLPEKIDIIAGLLYNLDFEHPVNLVVTAYSGEENLVVSLQLMKMGGQLSLLLAVNYDPQESRIIGGVENLARTYKRSYLILDDQLIALTDLYSRKREDRLIEENIADDLARFYIYDGKRSNDAVAEGLLIGSIRRAPTLIERGTAQLTLCRCYLAQGRLKEAGQLLLAAQQSLSRTGDELSDELREMLALAFDEYLITEALKSYGQRLEEASPRSL